MRGRCANKDGNIRTINAFREDGIGEECCSAIGAAVLGRANTSLKSINLRRSVSGLKEFSAGLSDGDAAEVKALGMIDCGYDFHSDATDAEIEYAYR